MEVLSTLFTADLYFSGIWIVSLVAFAITIKFLFAIFRNW